MYLAEQGTLGLGLIREVPCPRTSHDSPVDVDASDSPAGVDATTTPDPSAIALAVPAGTCAGNAAGTSSLPLHEKQQEQDPQQEEQQKQEAAVEEEVAALSPQDEEEQAMQWAILSSIHPSTASAAEPMDPEPLQHDPPAEPAADALPYHAASAARGGSGDAWASEQPLLSTDAARFVAGVAAAPTHALAATAAVAH